MAIVGVLVAAFALGLFALSRMDFGESKSDTTEEDTAAEFPDFHASDPELIRVGRNRISVLVTGASDGTNVPGVQYFIALSDGRWACGYADNSGKTRPIYTAQPVEFKLYCCEEAMALWKSHRPGALATTGPDQPRVNCLRVEKSAGSSDSVFKCEGW
jgi:hypothetical protein